MGMITNETRKNHLDAIKGLMNKSKKILIAVAFLKRSGLVLLKANLETALKKEAIVKIFCGLNFYFTDPDALREILKLFKKYQGGKLYLYESNKVTFHPKLYCFISQKTVSILIGSVNFTQGGFQNNIELSTLEKTTIESEVYNEVNSFFKAIEKSSNTVEANELNISQYKRKYDVMREKRKKANKEAEKEIKAVKELSISTIKKHLARYNKDKEAQSDYKERLSNYKKARKILDEMCDKSITSKKEFMSYYESLIDKNGLWHSDGLYRHKNMVAPNYKTFIKMVREIRGDILKSPKDVFEIGLKYVKKVKGLGVNVLTEVMNTYDSNKFAPLNKNPVTSLKFCGSSKFPAPNTFKTDTYEIYNSLISEFMKICGFKSMGRADHFLNYLYWGPAQK